MTEAYGVRGSTPRIPILIKNFYKDLLIILNIKMVNKKSKDIGEGIGISGFTLGILSILLAGAMGIFMAVIGFIFCFFQQKRNPTQLGKVGIILNVVGFVLSIVFMFWLVPQLASQFANL